MEAIVAGMKAHPSRINVSQQGALALGDLAWSNSAVQQRVGQCGGIQVAAAMAARRPPPAVVRRRIAVDTRAVSTFAAAFRSPPPAAVVGVVFAWRSSPASRRPSMRNEATEPEML